MSIRVRLLLKVAKEPRSSNQPQRDSVQPRLASRTAIPDDTARQGVLKKIVPLSADEANIFNKSLVIEAGEYLREEFGELEGLDC